MLENTREKYSEKVRDVSRWVRENKKGLKYWASITLAGAVVSIPASDVEEGAAAETLEDQATTVDTLLSEEEGDGTQIVNLEMEDGRQIYKIKVEEGETPVWASLTYKGEPEGNGYPAPNCTEAVTVIGEDVSAAYFEDSNCNGKIDVSGVLDGEVSPRFYTDEDYADDVRNEVKNTLSELTEKINRQRIMQDLTAE